MKRCKQDEELANTNPQPFPSNEPSPETLEAIREGDAFFATGECGRFDNGADLGCTTHIVIQNVVKNPA